MHHKTFLYSFGRENVIYNVTSNFCYPTSVTSTNFVAWQQIRNVAVFAGVYWGIQTALNFSNYFTLLRKMLRREFPFYKAR